MSGRKRTRADGLTDDAEEARLLNATTLTGRTLDFALAAYRARVQEQARLEQAGWKPLTRLNRAPNLASAQAIRRFNTIYIRSHQPLTRAREEAALERLEAHEDAEIEQLGIWEAARDARLGIDEAARDVLLRIEEASKAAEEATKEAMARIAEADKRNRERMTCAVCLERPKVMSARACGHLSVCEECSASMDRCSLCRGDVAAGGWQRIYF